MSHTPQADNYSVSYGVRRRVGCGTDWGRRMVGGESGAAQWFITTVLNTHPSSATCLLQPRASSLAVCPRVTRWHWLFFHVLQLHATPIKPWAAPLHHNKTPVTDWEQARQTTAAIGHKSFAGWQLLSGYLETACFIVCVRISICWVWNKNVWLKVGMFVRSQAW